MSDSWNRAHRRYRLVHAVLAGIARTGRPEVPARLAAAVDAEFGDFGEFLRDVQARWYRAFDARLDTVLEVGPDDLPAAVADVWRGLSDTMPAARLLLDAHAEHPALTALHEHHRRTLRAATGIRHELRCPA
ncbi:MAG TPA: hypothetical protein VGX25_22690 [Actinophytocola sp.]|uniref:hypothetical protein n=1 Tax=Actinophytocola sp. TaxID=1872138 RepID=UPI002DDDAF9A|nr:hypothetical protein [Actinophytocola sp.]HEV2782209.1 hypothetical protein [Actinophytocola sp.]